MNTEMLKDVLTTKKSRPKNERLSFKIYLKTNYSTTKRVFV